MGPSLTPWPRSRSASTVWRNCMTRWIPAPFQERALDRSAESYILACAGRHRPTEPLRLLVHFPESLRSHAADATDGIHEHLRRTHAQDERKFRRRMRLAGFALAAALGVLAGSFGLRTLLSDVEGRALVQGLGEGLLILGWVAMWRPVEILLFEHWERHLDHAMLKRLGSIPIEFMFRPVGLGSGSTPAGEDRSAGESPGDHRGRRDQTLSHPRHAPGGAGRGARVRLAHAGAVPRAGIVEHGLFLGLIADVIVAGNAGITHRTRP